MKRRCSSATTHKTGASALKVGRQHLDRLVAQAGEEGVHERHDGSPLVFPGWTAGEARTISTGWPRRSWRAKSVVTGFTRSAAPDVMSSVRFKPSAQRHAGTTSIRASSASGSAASEAPDGGTGPCQ